MLTRDLFAVANLLVSIKLQKPQVKHTNSIWSPYKRANTENIEKSNRNGKCTLWSCKSMTTRNSKGNAALDDITLWANRRTISQFHYVNAR